MRTRMRGRWLTDWDEAKLHPWRMRAASLVGFGVVGVVFILRMGRNLPWPSWVAVVLGFAILGVAMSETAMRQTAQDRRIQATRSLRALGIQALVLGCGIGIALTFHSLGVLTGALAAVMAVAVAVWARNRRKR
jgi:O-antigen/teichoic acid export membrane protein